jgi:hypothetical protein
VILGGLPAVFGKVASVCFVKDNPLGFEQLPLEERALDFRVGADSALMIDNPLPGHIVESPAGMHGIPDGAGRARRAKQGGDLPVGHHAPAWDLSHDMVYGFVKGIHFVFLAGLVTLVALAIQKVLLFKPIILFLRLLMNFLLPLQDTTQRACNFPVSFGIDYVSLVLR